jgi:glutamine synthetase
MNPITQLLTKSPDHFTKKDLIYFANNQGIEVISLKHVDWSGKLRSIDYVLRGPEHLQEILTYGERVDGSSLFPYVAGSNSDLYIIPRYSTAMLDPFSETLTLSFLCSYFDESGKPFEGAPEFILKKAHESFKRASQGDVMHAMAVLKFYAITPVTPTQYDNGHVGEFYQQSSPFFPHQDFLRDICKSIASTGCIVKHFCAESGTFQRDGQNYQQMSISLDSRILEDAADQIIIAKWVIRTAAASKKMLISFAPLLSQHEHHPGNTMEMHCRVLRNGKNSLMSTSDGHLNYVAHKLIAGFMQMGGSITAFGASTCSSYWRLQRSHGGREKGRGSTSAKEPMVVAWGERNQQAFVTVPIAWSFSHANAMASAVNPQETSTATERNLAEHQAVVIRAGDSAAHAYLYLAALAVAASYGQTVADPQALTERTQLGRGGGLGALAPSSCVPLPSDANQAASQLQAARAIYQSDGIFPAAVIDCVLEELQAVPLLGVSEMITVRGVEVMQRELHAG